MIARIDRCIAIVAVAEQVRNPRQPSGCGPELLGGWPANNCQLVHLATLDHLDQRFVAAPGLERAHEISHEPWPHGVMGGLAAQRLEQPATGPAYFAHWLGLAAVWTDQDFGFRHQFRSSQAVLADCSGNSLQFLQA